MKNNKLIGYMCISVLIFSAFIPAVASAKQTTLLQINNNIFNNLRKTFEIIISRLFNLQDDPISDPVNDNDPEGDDDDEQNPDDPSDEVDDELLVGDLNDDKCVNEKDLKIIEGFWLLSGPYSIKSPDINNDGMVDVIDLLSVVGSFGACDFGDHADLNNDMVVSDKDKKIVEAFWGEEAPYHLRGTPDLNGDDVVDIIDHQIVLGSWD